MDVCVCVCVCGGGGGGGGGGGLILMYFFLQLQQFEGVVVGGDVGYDGTLVRIWSGDDVCVGITN